MRGRGIVVELESITGDIPVGYDRNEAHDSSEYSTISYCDKSNSWTASHLYSLSSSQNASIASWPIESAFPVHAHDFAASASTPQHIIVNPPEIGVPRAEQAITHRSAPDSTEANLVPTTKSNKRGRPRESIDPVKK